MNRRKFLIGLGAGAALVSLPGVTVALAETPSQSCLNSLRMSPKFWEWAGTHDLQWIWASCETRRWMNQLVLQTYIIPNLKDSEDGVFAKHMVWLKNEQAIYRDAEDRYNEQRIQDEIGTMLRRHLANPNATSDKDTVALLRGWMDVHEDINNLRAKYPCPV